MQRATSKEAFARTEARLACTPWSPFRQLVLGRGIPALLLPLYAPANGGRTLETELARGHGHCPPRAARHAEICLMSPELPKR